MKRSIVLGLVMGAMSFGVAQAQTKERYQQDVAAGVQPVPSTKGAPIVFHVTHSFLSSGYEATYQHLVGVLNGRNVELATLVKAAGDLAFMPLLPLGDYQVLPAGSKTQKNGAKVKQYKVAYSDGETGLYGVIGVSE